MTINMSFKQIKTSEAIKDYTREKSEHLKKFFNGKIVVSWNFSVTKLLKVAHCHLVGNNMDYFGEASSEDLNASIDMVIEKLEKQLRKHKEIVKNHHHPDAHRVPVAAIASEAMAAGPTESDTDEDVA